MKLNKIVLGLAMIFGLASQASAVDGGHGTITFMGAVTDPLVLSNLHLRTRRFI